MLGLVLLTQSCHSNSVADSQELETVVLQLKWKHQFQFAGYYAALNQGYYEEVGLDVQVLEADDGVEPAQVVLDGDADFGIAASDLLLLHAKGEPVIALAAIYQHSPLVLLSITKRDVDNIHDLAGKPVMIEPHAAELLAYLEAEGISENALTRMPHNYDPEALMLNQVVAMSAYSTDEPFLLSEAGFEYQIFNPRASGIDFYGDTLFTTEKYIQDHPDQTNAFLDASLRGWKYALDHPEEMVDLIYNDYSQRHSKEHLLFEAERTKKLILPDVVEIGYMNPGRWQRIGEIYAEMNMISPEVNLNKFLYDRNPRPNLTWFYLTLLGIFTILGISSFISARFYRLNTALRHEMKEREKTEQDLRVLEKRYRVLAENAPFPIIITHLEKGTLLYINPKASEKYEIKRQHAIGKSALGFYVNTDDRKVVMDVLHRQGFIQNHDVEHVSAGGKKFWVALSASVIIFEGEPASFFSIVDVTERRKMAKRLEEIALIDVLTGIANRRSFMQRIDTEFSRAQRYKTPLSLLMIDIDDFKKINDGLGHLAGDQVLRHISAVFREYFRDADFPGRIGGDEFGVILPNTTLADARQLAERIRAIISEEYVEYDQNQFKFTMSFGVAEMHESVKDVDELIRKADEALYRAKNSGKDQVAL